MKRWVRMGLGIAMGLGFLFAGTARAEHPEKVDEAIDLIKEKTLIQSECGEGIKEYCFQIVSFDDEACEITAKQVYSKKQFDKPRLVFIGKARLKDLNPKFFKAEGNLIELYTTNGEKRILNSQNGTVEKASTLYIYTNTIDPAQTQRVAKALGFLIELCGGQESYF